MGDFNEAAAVKPRKTELFTIKDGIIQDNFNEAAAVKPRKTGGQSDVRNNIQEPTSMRPRR